MKYTIIIPARMNSTRLPQKMMRDLNGMPLIECTWRQAKKTSHNRIIVATDDAIIFEHMVALGAEVVMTKKSHVSGTDRLSEVVSLLGFADDDIIVNWQGDEPFLPISLLDQIVQLLISEPTSAISTLGILIENMAEFLDPNVVKVVRDHIGFALYFSRAPIPFPRDIDLSSPLPSTFVALKHLGVYAYRSGFLKKYQSLDPVEIELSEKLEQLRALHNGFKIVVGTTNIIPPTGIDTLSDLENANNWLRSQ